MAYTEQDKKQVIKEIQTFLHELSFQNENIPVLIPDGIFGQKTTAAIVAFQKDYGLNPTGVVNQKTWDALFKAYTDAIRLKITPQFILPFPNNLQVYLGDKGYVVYIIQVMLNAVGENFNNMMGVPIDGNYDTRTQELIKTVQSKSGLPITGVVDKETWNALAKVYNVWGVKENRGDGVIKVI